MFQNILLIYSEKITEDHLNMVKAVKYDIEKFKMNVNVINVKYMEKKYFETYNSYTQFCAWLCSRYIKKGYKKFCKRL